MRVEARVVGRVDAETLRRIRENSVNLRHVHARGASYAGRTLEKFCSVGCRFMGCQFERMRINDAAFGSGMEMSEYVDCVFDGLRFDHATGNARFVRCSFREVDLRSWYCYAVEMIDCVFTGRLEEMVFHGTVSPAKRAFLHRERNEFHGNDFSGVDLIDVAFRRGIDLTQQRLPAGPQYLYLPDAAAALAHAQSVAAGWRVELREEALAVIRTCRSSVDGGQRQLLLRPDNYYSSDPLSHEAVDKLFALFRPYAVVAGTDRPSDK